MASAVRHCSAAFQEVAEVTETQMAEAVREFIVADNDRVRVCIDVAHFTRAWVCARHNLVR